MKGMHVCDRCCRWEDGRVCGRTGHEVMYAPRNPDFQVIASYKLVYIPYRIVSYNPSRQDNTTH